MSLPADNTGIHADAFALLEKLLNHADNSKRFPEHAALDFLELSGAQTIVIIECQTPLTGHRHRILAKVSVPDSSPPEDSALFALIDQLHGNDDIQILNPLDSSQEGIFTSKIITGASMVIPLNAHGTRCGGLLLLNLPSGAQIEELQRIFRSLSQLVALILRNALYAEAQETKYDENSVELERHRRSLQAFFDNELVGMVQRDAENNYLEVNHRWEVMTGYPRQELLRLKPADIIHPDDFPSRQHHVDQLKTGRERTFRCVRRYIRKDGTIFWGDVSATTLYNDQGRYIGMISMIVDVTEQRQALLNLQESETKFRVLLNSQNDAILLHKIVPYGYTTFTEVNNTAIERYGYSREEFLNLSIRDLTTEEIIENHKKSGFLKTLVNEGHRVFESVHLTKSGHEIPVEVSATVLNLNGEQYFLSTARDISERKAADQTRQLLEEQLRQKYKMEAVGLLAGGVAHNFNNSLGVILGNVELAQVKKNEPQDAARYLENAKTAILHTRNLVKQILAYSRQDTHEQVPSYLPLIIEQTIKLIQSTIPTSITVLYSPPEKNLSIMADSSRIQEAIINLCNNAVYAMNEKGELNISLTEVDLEQRQIPMRSQCRAGRYACLSVKDSGCGMSRDVQERIFDPFFTTKPPEKGTGMGLSTVQGTIDQHGGFIEVSSIPEAGTTFRLFFPIIREQTQIQANASDPDMPTGSEHILFVDDDKMLAELSEAMLIDMGYDVTIATDSENALELFQQNPRHFDLLISDQTMPKLTGIELLKKVLRVRPDMPTILCTGYSSKISEEEVKQLGIGAFCFKPLEMSVFLKTIRRLLDQNNSAPG